MLMNCYYVKNTLSKLADGIMLYPTNAFAVSQVQRKLESMSEDLNDYELHNIGHFDTESYVMTLTDDILIPFNTRDVVETPPIDIAPNEVIKNINSVR